MPEDQIEMLWRCEDPGCNNENRGRFKKCERCGRPKTKEDGFYMPGDISHAAAVTDAGMLRHAKGGEDWFCHFCGSRQYRADKICDNCGVDQGQGIKKETGAPVSLEVELGPLPTWYRDKELWKHVLIWGGCGIVTSALILLFAFLVRPKIVDATVDHVSWRSDIHIEKFALHGHEGFNPPGNAVNERPLGDRFHHYDHIIVGYHDEEYQDGTHACGKDCSWTRPSCYTTARSCRNNKNGFASCTGGDRVCPSPTYNCTTKYCPTMKHHQVADWASIPVSAPYFSWEEWEWAPYREVVKTGDDTSPFYGDPALITAQDNGEMEREASRDMLLTVHFTNGKDGWDYHPELAIFKHMEPGSHHRVKVSKMLGVEAVDVP